MQQNICRHGLYTQPDKLQQVNMVETYIEAKTIAIVCFVVLADVTLVDEDTNWILADDNNQQ